MKIYIKVYYILSFLCIITGCKENTIENKLVGGWSVDINPTVIEQNNWFNIYGNLFTLEDGFTCELLPFRNSTTDKLLPSKGTWRIISGDGQDSIILNVLDNPMSGKYKMDFYRDFDNKLLKIRLSNDSMQFTCSKFLQNFDRVKDW